MRLLLITNDFPNPLQPIKAVFNLEMARALARQHEVRVVAPISWVDECRLRIRHGKQLPPDRHVIIDGVAVHHPRYYYPPKLLRNQYGWFFWRSIRGTIARLLEEWQPDVVMGYWAHPDGEAAVRAARLAHVPAAIMVGGSDVLLLTRKPGRRRRIVAALKAADAAIATSHDLRSKLLELGVAAEKTFVAHRGIDKERFCPGDRGLARRNLGLAQDGNVLVWVGRIVPMKGLDVLLDACAILRSRGERFHLHVLGEGPLRSRLRAHARNRGLGEMVWFMGPIAHDRLPDWYRAANLTVLPSRSEGLPNVLRESLACGTPFVASQVGGVEEIVAGNPCMLVPPNDAQALASAIAAMLATPASQVSPPVLSDWNQSAQAIVNVLRQLQTPPIAGGGSIKSAFGWRRAVKSAMAAALPRRLLLVNGPRNSERVALTFDDGPHPQHTPRLLNVLRELNVKATFFVVGQAAQQFPELVRRIAAEGHAVGHHSFSHGKPEATSTRQLLSEVQRTSDLLRHLLGTDPVLFRPPHGRLSLSKLLGLWRRKQQIVLWNADPRDYASQRASELEAWFDRHPLSGGEIVLLHDRLPHASEALPAVVRAARRRRPEIVFSTVEPWLQ